MKRRVSTLLISLVLLAHALESAVIADPPEFGGAQNLYEKEQNAVVRNKRYYKAGKFEIGVTGGLLPYDSMYDQYFLGGRATWHITDHYGWEIVDFQKVFPQVTSFTTSLVSDHNKNIADLQGVKMDMAIGSNFVMSPFYGKIRFFGSVYLDIYLMAGLGIVSTETTRYAYQATNSYVASSIRKGWDASFNYGLGFRFFVSNQFSVLLDMRSYMTLSPVYGKNSLRNNFTTFVGFSFFLPNFG